MLLLILAGLEDRPEARPATARLGGETAPPHPGLPVSAAPTVWCRQGDNVGAEEARREAERLAPSTAFDHFITGLEQFGRRKWAAALRHFDASLRLQPDHFWAHALSAQCCLQPESNRAERAQVHLGACLQREPGLAWLYLLRGFASYQAAVLAREAGKTRPARGTRPRWRPWPHSSPPRPITARPRTCWRESPNTELHYILLVNRGLLRLEQRQWDGAVRDLEAAIRLDGRHYLAYANLAQVYQRQDKPDEAVAQFTRAIAVRPRHARPLQRPGRG